MKLLVDGWKKLVWEIFVRIGLVTKDYVGKLIFHCNGGITAAEKNEKFV